MILIKREKERKSFSCKKIALGYASNFFVGGEKADKFGNSIPFQ